MNKKNELLQVVEEMHYQAAGDWDIARSQAKNWADRLSTLTAQGGEIPQILRDSLEEALKWSPKSFAGADAIRKFQELAGDYVQRLIEEGTTPPAPGSSAVDGELRKAAEIVCLAAAAKNVLAIMRGCERLSKALASTATSGGECQHEWQPDADVEDASYCRRCDVTRRIAAPAMPEEARLIAEAAEVLQMVADSGVALPGNWRWPLLDELSGLAAILAAASAQGDGDE